MDFWYKRGIFCPLINGPVYLCRMDNSFRNMYTEHKNMYTEHINMYTEHFFSLKNTISFEYL